MSMVEREWCRSGIIPEVMNAGNMVNNHITVIAGWGATKVLFDMSMALRAGILPALLFYKEDGYVSFYRSGCCAYNTNA